MSSGIEKESTANSEAEWQAQGMRLAKLYAGPQGQSEDEYLGSLPKFFPQPENYQGRLDIPRIVPVPTEKVPLDKMLIIAGVVLASRGPNVNDIIKDWKNDPFGFVTPPKPYVSYFSDESLSQPQAANDIRRSLDKDIRGGTILDALARFINNPNVLFRYYLETPGSELLLGSEIGSVYLRNLNGQINLGAHSPNHRDDKCRPIIAGREIRV